MRTKSFFCWMAAGLLISVYTATPARAVDVSDEAADIFDSGGATFDSSNQFALLAGPTTSLDVSPKASPASAPTTTTAIKPESSSAAAGQFPTAAGSFGLEEFINHFAPHEPMYFVGGTKAPSIKFQLSIRYRLLTPTGPWATKYPLLKGFNFAYTQTSFWDFSSSSSPFFYDSSYKPEFMYYLENIPKIDLPKDWQLGAQVGLEHESNGQRKPDHRSLNIVYLRPIFTVSGAHDLFFTFAPKFFGYIGDKSLNSDIATFRGYCELRFVIGQRDGLQLATIGRVGNHWNRGSAQLDLTYPLTKLLNGNADISIDAQYFLGYGDSLLSYNQRTSIIRIGLAVVR